MNKAYEKISGKSKDKNRGLFLIIPKNWRRQKKFRMLIYKIDQEMISINEHKDCIYWIDTSMTRLKKIMKILEINPQGHQSNQEYEYTSVTPENFKGILKKQREKPIRNNRVFSQKIKKSLENFSYSE